MSAERAFPKPLMGWLWPEKKNPAQLAAGQGSNTRNRSCLTANNLDRISRECKADQRRDLSENGRIFSVLSVSERPKDLESI